jgi:hypothetical protein
VRANTRADIIERLVDELEGQFTLLPDFLAYATNAQAIDSELYATSEFTQDTSGVITYDFNLPAAAVAAGFYKLPVVASADSGLTATELADSDTVLEKVEFYAIMFNSGAAAATLDDNSGLAVISGLTINDSLSSGLAGISANGDADKLFMLIDAETGEVAFGDAASDIFDVSDAPASVVVEVVARVRLSTDSVTDTYEIDFATLKHKITVFENPGS